MKEEKSTVLVVVVHVQTNPGVTTRETIAHQRFFYRQNTVDYYF